MYASVSLVLSLCVCREIEIPCDRDEEEGILAQYSWRLAWVCLSSTLYPLLYLCRWMRKDGFEKGEGTEKEKERVFEIHHR